MKGLLLMTGESPCWCSDLSLRTTGMWRIQRLQHLPLKHLFELSFPPLPPVPFLCSPEPTASRENWSALLSPPATSGRSQPGGPSMHVPQRPRWGAAACTRHRLECGLVAQDTITALSGSGDNSTLRDSMHLAEGAFREDPRVGKIEVLCLSLTANSIHNQHTESDFPLLRSLPWW